MCQSGLQVACRAAALQRGGGKAGKVQVPQRLWRRWTEQSQHLRGPFKSLLIALLTPPFHSSFFCLCRSLRHLSILSSTLISLVSYLSSLFISSFFLTSHLHHLPLHSWLFIIAGLVAKNDNKLLAVTFHTLQAVIQCSTFLNWPQINSLFFKWSWVQTRVL